MGSFRELGTSLILVAVVVFFLSDTKECSECGRWFV